MPAVGALYRLRGVRSPSLCWRVLDFAESFVVVQAIRIGTVVRVTETYETSRRVFEWLMEAV